MQMRIFFQVLLMHRGFLSFFSQQFKVKLIQIIFYIKNLSTIRLFIT
ncbi:hypothetical Protein YC6258_05014 [Gynuella sunshinyii YC6258]|uniref:Uncharacterized protein n=1 Tax=Gynuella sunshinyii YC6258 TaxID=1445510 RepID=A0A0C5VS45_9GAMM|nr:hypothetical Protein YC6258_05014 [Gynuella sunshinyii YC6258]